MILIIDLGTDCIIVFFDDIYIFNCDISFEVSVYSYIVDKMGMVSNDLARDRKIIQLHFQNNDSNAKWYDPYTIIELFFEFTNSLGDYDVQRFFNSLYDFKSELDCFSKRINTILSEEKSGYRLIDYKFRRITDKEEMESIKETINGPFDSVSTHMKKALDLYSDRENPDYENSIKESISAVEAMCCIITEESGAQATLGKTIKLLKDNGVVIHSALEQAFSKIYGYTSDEDGIRHGSIDFKNAPEEDALYMLVSCSAFINYLKQKYELIEKKC